jgi:two-component system phosphate regulon sensor histidine kinase PhoR
MKNLDLRWRHFLPIFLVIITATLILTNQISQRAYQQEINLIEDRLITELEMIDFFLDGDWGKFSTLFIRDGSIQTDPISILTPTGEILFQTDSSQEFNLSFIEFQKAMANGSGFAIRENTNGENFAYATIAAIGDDDQPFLIHVSYPLAGVDAARAKTTQLIWLIAGITLVALAGLTFFPMSGYIKRLKTLTRKTDLLSLRVYGEPIPIDNRDILSQAEHALNRLNVELGAKFARLEAEQTQLNAILEQMTDGVMILTEEGEITLVNPTAREIFNLDQADFIGQTLPRVLGNHQIVELWQNFSASGEEQAAFLELPDRKKSIQAIIIPFEQTLPGNALILFQDLTRLRQLETVRRDFISNISHELRTPLASLKALAETLQISALDDPDSARKFLDRMDTEIDALTQLVSELLELSRIESGQVPLQFSPTNPAKLIASAYERLKVQADRAEIDYLLECPQTDATILVDTNRIEQTLVNLIHNAIKYTDPGGTVTCTVEIIADEAVFKIKDTGLGISAKDLPRIFERFYKVRNSRKSSGTGLGLAIAKHLVGLHNGRIWAESQLGAGSTFFIALPIFS